MTDNSETKDYDPASDAQLFDIVLASTACTTSNDFQMRLAGDAVNLESGAGISEIAFAEGSQRSRVTCVYRATFDGIEIDEDNEESESALLIEATYYIYFHFDEGDDKEDTKNKRALLSMRSGVMGAYPYFRRLVSSFAEQARLTLPLLPLLKPSDVVLPNGVLETQTAVDLDEN